MPALECGLVQVYTGEGKGKTTAALGLVLRATGWRLHSYVAQFMKHQDTGERRALPLLAPFVTAQQFGRPGFLALGQATDEDIALAHEGLEQARAAMLSGQYDLVVLDEVNTAVHFGLLAERELLSLIEDKPEHVELVLTGRSAAPRVLARADLVTRMVEEKHPYQKGIGARRGIEF